MITQSAIDAAVEAIHHVTLDELTAEEADVLAKHALTAALPHILTAHNSATAELRDLHSAEMQGFIVVCNSCGGDSSDSYPCETVKTLDRLDSEKTL